MRSEPHFARALIAAVALHSAGAWVIHALYTHNAPPKSESARLDTTEIDVVVEPAARVEPGPEAPSTSATAESEPRAIAHAEVHSSPQATGSVIAPTEAPASSSTPAPQGTWSFSATAPTAPDGGAAPLGGIAEATRDGVRATIAADEKRRDALPVYRARDIELGLAPGGQFVQMTRDAVRSSRAPSFGHAMLEFQTNAAGLVVSVRVLEASSDRSAWDEIAAEIAAHPRMRPEKVPAGANGIAVTLDVTSAMKTVSGASTNAGTLEKIVGAINDPIDTIIDAKNPPQRIVAARVVDVQAF